MQDRNDLEKYLNRKPSGFVSSPVQRTPIQQRLDNYNPDDYDATEALLNAPAQDRGIGGLVKDLGLSVAKGAVKVPGTVLAAAETPFTGGSIGKRIEDTGFNFGDKARDYLDTKHTEKHKEIQAGYQALSSDDKSFAEEAVDKLGYVLSNPSMIADTVSQSLPDMVAGAKIGGKLSNKGKRFSAEAGAGIGEGAMMMGHQAEAIRGEQGGEVLTPEQRGYAGLTGVAGALFAWGGNRVAKRFGVADVDTLLAKGLSPREIAANISSLPAKSVPKAIVQGAIQEGFLEELPQEVSETILQNLALDRDWNEGLADAVVMAPLAGMAMGGPVAGVGAYSSNRQRNQAAAQAGDTGTDPAIHQGPSTAPPEGPAPYDRLAPQQVQDEYRIDRPSQRMGLNPDTGPLSAAAATAVDSGVGAIPDMSGALSGEFLGGQEAIRPSGFIPRGARTIDVDTAGNPVSVDGQAVQGYRQLDAERTLGYAERPVERAPLYEVDPDGVARPTSGEAARSRKERVDLSGLEGRQQAPEQKQTTAIPEQRSPEERARHSWDSMNTFERNKAATDTLGHRGVLAKNIAGKTWEQLSDKDRQVLVAATEQSTGQQRWDAPNQRVIDRDRPVLQNRDRSTDASIAQMQGIRNNPDYNRLSVSRDFGNGAPVVEPSAVFPDSQLGRTEQTSTSTGRVIETQYAVIEADQLIASNDALGSPVKNYASGVEGKSRAIAGNGRVAGLQAAWQEGKAQTYKQKMLEDNLHGIDPGVIEAMKQPVLVRIMPLSEVTNNIGDESNISGQAGLSPTEQASTDMRRIDLTELRLTKDNEMSEETVLDFIKGMPQSEIGTLLNKSGRPTPAAYARAEAALFQQAYQNDALTENLVDLKGDAKFIMNALMRAAPAMAKLEGAGIYDIRPLVSQAAEVAVNARRQGVTLREFIKNDDFGRDPRVQPILEMMVESGQRTTEIGDKLINLAELAYAEANKAGQDMFGEVDKLSPEELMRAAFDGEQTNEQKDTRTPGPLGDEGGARPDAQHAEGRPTDGREPADGGEVQANQPEEQGQEVAPWGDRSFTLKTDDEFGPPPPHTEAYEAAKSAPSGSVTHGLTVRSSGKQWHNLYLSHGGGDFSSISVGRDMPDNVTELIEQGFSDYDKKKKKQAKIAEEKAAASIKEIAIAKENNLALGRELGIIIPNTGKQFRSAKIIADHGDGTFTLSGVQGNKQAQLSRLPASSIVRAIDRYTQESGIKSEGDSGQQEQQFQVETDLESNSVRVYGDANAIREQLRANGINFPGAEIDGGLSFGLKIEQRIRDALNQQEVTDELTYQADDTPLEIDAEEAATKPKQEAHPLTGLFEKLISSKKAETEVSEFTADDGEVYDVTTVTVRGKLNVPQRAQWKKQMGLGNYAVIESSELTESTIRLTGKYVGEGGEYLARKTTYSKQQPKLESQATQSNKVGKKQAHTTIMSEWVESEIENSKYAQDYKDDPGARRIKERQLARDWRNAVLEKAKTERIPTEILDDIVSREGEDALLSTFRGQHEKGIEGYDFPTSRMWDKTYRQFLSSSTLAFKQANSGKMKEIHARIVNDAIERGEPVPENVRREVEPLRNEEVAQDLELTQQTEESLAEEAKRLEQLQKEEAAQKAKQKAAEKKERERDADKARADEVVDYFQLGQSAEDAMSGMGDIFATESKPAEESAENKKTSSTEEKDNWAIYPSRKPESPDFEYRAVYFKSKGRETLYSESKTFKSEDDAFEWLSGKGLKDRADAFLAEKSINDNDATTGRVLSNPVLSRSDKGEIVLTHDLDPNGKVFSTKYALEKYGQKTLTDWFDIRKDLLRQFTQLSKPAKETGKRKESAADKNFNFTAIIRDSNGDPFFVNTRRGGKANVAPFVNGKPEIHNGNPTVDLTEYTFDNEFWQDGKIVSENQEKQAITITDSSVETFNNWSKNFYESVSGWRLFDFSTEKFGPDISLARKLKETNAAGGGYTSAQLVNGFSSVQEARDWAKANKVTATSPKVTMQGGAENKEISQKEKPAKPEKQTTTDNPIAPIEDFGEKMAGARKDEMKSLDVVLTDDDIANQTLSKIWPAKEVMESDDDFVAAFSYVARSQIPAKPRVKHRLSRWVQVVQGRRRFAQGAKDGKITIDSLERTAKRESGLEEYANKVKLLMQLERKDWGRVGEVYDYSKAYRYDDEGNKQPIPHMSVSIDGVILKVDGATTIEETFTEVKKAISKEKKTGPVNDPRQFEIRSVRSTGEIFINRKGDKERRRLKSFKKGEIAAARDFVKNNTDELAAAWEAVKERDNVSKADVRSDTNAERVGKDYRNGKDVTSEEFGETFGFRGVEFGNWVSQGKGQADRQGMLNAAYDALLDLASVVGLPPKAISLNGSLGIAFGSRGKGRASAHYETDNIVINLTKTKGAGSLAHEWFHALDNYFSRRRGVTPFDGNNAAYNKANYITYKPEPMMALKSSLNKNGLRPYLITKASYDRRLEQGVNFDAAEWTPDPNHPEGVRPVVEKAFADLVNELDKSPMLARAEKIDKGKADGYWSSIIERAARSFESYVIKRLEDQGITNDYLANVVPITGFKRDEGRYPYLTDVELKPVAEKFDALFNTIETREEKDGNFLLFSRHNNRPSNPTTAASLLKSINDNFPSLTSSVVTMLQRGRKGQKGGLVIVDSNNGADIAKAYSDATGMPIKDAYRLFSDGESINGFHDTKSGITFLIGPNLDAATAPAVLFHEVIHSQQRRKIDARSMKLINGRANEKNADLRAFLEAVAQRMIDAGEQGNPLESTSYIVEQAVIEGRSQGYTLADSKFMNAIEKAFGKTVADIIRDFTKMLRQFALRHGLPINVTIDDLVQYAMVGVKQAAAGKSTNKTIAEQAYSFAGESALTADKDSLRKAQDMLIKGMSAEEIRQDTGWFQGVDNNWRFEVSDDKAKFVDAPMLDAYLTGKLTGAEKLNKKDQAELNKLKLRERKLHAEMLAAIQERKTDAFDAAYEKWHEAKMAMTPLELRARGDFTTLGSILEHQQLFEAYPELEKVRIRLAVDDSVAMNGFFDRRANLIEITAPNKDILMSGLLHEIQHAIQNAEGFARGGTPSFFDYKDDTDNQLSQISNDLSQLLDSNQDFGDAVRAVKREWNRLINKYPKQSKDGQQTVDWDEIPQDEQAAYFKLLGVAEGFSEAEQWRDIETKYRIVKRDGATITPYEQYHRLAGEVEARNVESRRHMTDEERREFAPEATEDVSRSDQDVRFSRGRKVYNPNQGDLFAELEALSNDDPYENTKQRPGTTEKQRELGRSALSDFFRWLKNNSRARGDKAGAGSGEVSLLGASIYKDFQAGKPYQLIGQTIKSPKDLAALAQVYRDPRFETFRAFFVDKNGKIILEQMASTRMPSSVAFSDDIYMDLRRILESSGADKFYIMHNHPSGVPTPSPPDVAMTKHMGKIFGKEMAAHVVIDHNSYAVIDQDGNVTEHQDESLAGIDFSSNPEVEHASLNKQINSPQQMALVAKQVSHSDTPVIVVTRGGAVSKVGLIASVPMELLNKGNSDKQDPKFTAVIRRMIRAAGTGGKMFVVLPKSYGTQATGYHFENGSLQWMHEFAQDVVDSDGNSVIFVRYQVSIDDYAAVSIKDGRITKKRTTMRDSESRPYTDNIGTYDGTNPDIRFSRAPSIDTPAFKKWFGDSKVVDSNGDPLVVYHGSGAKFTVFDKELLGSTTGAESAKGGFFFTSNPALSNAFRRDTEGSNVDLKALRQMLMDADQETLENIGKEWGYNLDWDLDDGRDFYADRVVEIYKSDVSLNSTYDDNSGMDRILKKHFGKEFFEPGMVVNAYLKIENPYIVVFDEDADQFDEGAITNAIKKAKKEGRDGVILKNMIDAAKTDDKGNGGIRSDVYVVFEPTQIKSATDNNGDFDGTNPDIRFSRTAVKSAVDNLMTGAAQKLDGIGNRKRDMPKGLTPEQVAAANKFDTFRQRTTLQDKLDGLRSVTGKKIHQKVFDQFATLRDYSQKAFMQAHLSKGSETTVETVVRNGTPYLKDGAIAVDTSKGGFLDALKKHLGTPDEANRFFMWVAGNRADALSKEHTVYQDGKAVKTLKTKEDAEKFAATLDGKIKVLNTSRENLFTQDDIAALKKLNQGRTEDGKVRTLAYAEMHKELNRYQKALLDMAEQAGTVNAESRAQWESEFYVPFYRVMEKEDGSIDTRFGMSDTGLMRQEVIRRLKGGTENLGDPLNNLISNWEHIISSTMKNMAANDALKQAEQLGAARIVPKTEADGTMWTLQDGQRVYWEVADKDLIESITALNFQGYNNGLMKAAGAFKRMLTMGVTISPTFRIRSATRDILHALAVSDVGYNPIKNAIEGWKQTGQDSELMAQMLAGGGAIRFGSFTDGKSGDVTRRMLELDIKDDQILDTPEKFKRFFGKGFRGYMELGDRLENNSRIAAYQRAMEKTGDHLIASFEARDIMNFTSMGSSAAIRALAQTLPFFNARLQGMSKLYRGAKNDPRRFWSVVGTIGMASALLYLLNADDDEYKALPDYVRDTYWPIKVGGKWVYVPKPFEVGSMASVIERFTELAVAGDDYKARDFRDTIFSIMVNQLQLNPVPQIILPAAEAWYNYDMFRGRPIDSMAMERLMPGDRYNANTSAGAVALGRAMNVSPQKLEHMVNGYFGWLGLQALNVSDLLGRAVIDMPSSTKRDMTQTNNWFVVGDFVKEQGSGASKYSTRFYDTQREISQIYATANAARSGGDMERYQELMSDPKMGSRQMFNSARNRINLINKQIRVITADRELSAAEKTQRLKDLYERREQIARGVDEKSRR